MTDINDTAASPAPALISPRLRLAVDAVSDIRFSRMRTGLYLIVVLSVLALAGLGVFAAWELHKQQQHLMTALQAMEGAVTRQAAEQLHSHDAMLREELGQTMLELAVASSFFAAVLVLLCVMLIRRFTGPLTALISSTRQIGEGDLTTRLDVNEKTELGELAETVNYMTANLGKTAKRIRDTTISLSAMSSEIYKSVSTQSLGATKQAAAVTQIVDVLDQIKEILGQTLAETQTLDQTAGRILRMGEEGRRAADTARASMTDIQHHMGGVNETIIQLSNQSRQIGEITGAVQSLAQQSKMLAMNAAIEAAKAGAAGKGFGVVAGEVRKLAEQSELATVQVEKILDQIRIAAESAVLATEDGTKMVDIGHQQVGLLGRIVEEQVSLTEEVSKAGANITTMVRDEAGCVDQAVQAMGDIKHVVDDYVSTTRRNEQSAGEVSLLASRISDAVSSYKLK